jgi:para-nitrobenzyl esterase
MIVGVNKDEMRLYVAAAISSGTPFDAATYRDLMSDAFGADAARVEKTYPITGDDPWAPALAWSAAVTDAGWTCPTAVDEKALSRGRGAPVYGCRFADEQAPNDVGYPTPEGFPLGAAHGLELSYLFGAPPATAAQQRLSDAMITYWTRFAHTGSPNGSPGAPTWQPFGEGGSIQQLAPGKGRIHPVAPQQVGNCGLWQAVGLSSPALDATS